MLVVAAVGVQLLLLLLARSVQVKCVYWHRKIVSSALSRFSRWPGMLLLQTGDADRDLSGNCPGGKGKQRVRRSRQGEESTEGECYFLSET